MRARRKGVVLVTFAVALVVILGGAGLAFDIGRMYIAKIEAQSYVDAAALAAANQLDGQADALTRAEAAARQAYWKDWYFNTIPIPQADVTVQFGTGPDGPWGAPAAEATFARVRSSLQVPIYLARPLTAMDNGTVASVAVAGKELVTALSEGVFPFYMVSRMDNPPTPTSGFVVGRQYTFGWSNNAGKRLKLALNGGYRTIRNNNGSYPFADPRTVQDYLLHPEWEDNAKPEWHWCEGDTDDSFLEYLRSKVGSDPDANALFQSGGSWCSEGSNACGTKVAADGIQYGYQTQPVATGDVLTLPPGAKEALAMYIDDRVNLDPNKDLRTNSVKRYLNNDFDPDYDPNPDVGAPYLGDGVFWYNTDPPQRTRMIITPILTGESISSSNQGTVLGFGAFLLLTKGTEKAGKNPFYEQGNPDMTWCATYAGTATLWGMGSAPGPTGGVYYVRLFR